MLVKQRDQEIGIMLQYLNKKKAQEAAGGVPVQRTNEGFISEPKEEVKDSNPTLF